MQMLCISIECSKIKFEKFYLFNLGKFDKLIQSLWTEQVLKTSEIWNSFHFVFRLFSKDANLVENYELKKNTIKMLTSNTSRTEGDRAMFGVFKIGHC